MSGGGRTRNVNRRRLLRGIVERRSPELLATVDSIDDGVRSSFSRDKTREILVQELTENGLDDDDEPTGYGLVVEDLIDWVGKS